MFSAGQSLHLVASFLDEHDEALQFIAENPHTPAVHPVTGDQSWNFSDGRYRIFFRCVEVASETTVYLLHVIDKKESNLDIYPGNKIPTYDEE